jgi:transcriptional regulator with XRE-family HTH domain
MESAGTKLKNLRLQKGLSLEEVHKKTKIHLNILKAIEEDSLINFSPVYIKGFLKIYCKFLGVDPRDYIPDYKEPKAKIIYVSDLQEKPASSFKILSLKLFSMKALHIRPKTIVTVALILIFIIGLFNLGKFISSKSSRLSRKTELPIVASSKIGNRVPISKLQNSPAVKIITLDIHAKENCFIQLKADGRVIFQTVLKKGRSESWQAKDKIELSLGNAGVVELEVNGKRISGLGRRGQAIKNILITKEGLTIKR